MVIETVRPTCRSKKSKLRRRGSELKRDSRNPPDAGVSPVTDRFQLPFPSIGAHLRSPESTLELKTQRTKHVLVRFE
jgi:hypothetical protein